MQHEDKPETPGQPETIAPPPTIRDDKGDDTPPPMSIRGRGPMDQSVPDVATGSTPVTRRDD